MTTPRLTPGQTVLPQPPAREGSYHRDLRRRAAEETPEQRTPMMQDTIDEGGHLPEGLPPGVYPAADAQRQGRNARHPEVPMKPFGGDMTFDADGKPRPRAPSLITSMEAMPERSDPRYRAHWERRADEVGIDHSPYEAADLPLLEQHVRREEAEHRRREATGWDNVGVDNGTDARMYIPNPVRMAEHTEQRELDMTPKRKNQFAREIIERHGLTGTAAEDVLRMAQTDTGFEELRLQNAALNTQKKTDIKGNIEDRWKNINFTRDFNNPNIAPGMYARQLRQDVADGNFAGQAATHALFGNQPAASDAMAAGSVAATHQAAADERAAAIDAAKPKPALDELKIAMKDVLVPGKIPGPAEMTAAAGVFQRLYPDMTPAQAAAAADAYVTDHIAGIDGNHPLVKNKLQDLVAKGRGAFVQYATMTMGMSRQEAEKLFGDMQSPAQRGWSALGWYQ